MFPYPPPRAPCYLFAVVSLRSSLLLLLLLLWSVALRSYKVPDGKPENKFALDERCMGRPYAMKVVSECHIAWRNLVGKAEQGDVKSNLSVTRLSDMGSDIELDAAAHAFEDDAEGAGEGEDAGAGDEDGEYPTSLIA